MNPSKLLLDFYNAPSATAVHQMVVDLGLDGASNWKPYGGLPNNAGTFENQQASPESALVEKLTNSIDAILMKECHKRAIDPKNGSDPLTPHSMVQAIEEFYGVKGAKWENVAPKQRNAIAQNIQILVSGDRKTPNVAIYDNGEGQNPDNFENTLLSIQRGNKNDIPFVQGKYNFGATGAVVFCGDNYRYQMILSRRHSDCGDSDGSIGFTLVRKHILTKDEEKTVKLTWYEYLIIDGSVPRCFDDFLDLGLNGKAPFIEGTIVKMFSYQLTKASNATLDLWRELNPLLFEPAMPMLIFEQRDFKGHTPSKVLLGNRARIAIDGRDSLMHSKSLQISEFGGDIQILVYLFSQETKNNEFILRKSVIYTQNGQTQGTESTSFISQDLGFRNLRDYMLICVDLSEINATARGELFMASRDRLKKGKYYDTLQSDIIQLLKTDDDIKQWNQEYKGKIFKQSGQDKQLVESLFSKLKGDKDIRRMLSGSDGAFSMFTKKVPKPAKGGSGGGGGSDPAPKKKEFSSKRYPTYFKVKGFEKSNTDYIKAVNKCSQGRISLLTDAENEFLSRSDDPGSITVSVLDYGNNGSHGHGYRIPVHESTKLKVRMSGPYDGELRLLVEPTPTAEVGEIIPLSIQMISRAGEFEVMAYLKVEEEKKNTGGSGSETVEEPELNLPRLVRVVRESTNPDDPTWTNTGMNADSIVKYSLSGNGVIDAVNINIDSNLVKKLINAKGANVELIRDKYVTAMYSHALMLYVTMNGYYENGDTGMEKHTKDAVLENLNEALESSFKYYANFIMSFENFNV